IGLVVSYRLGPAHRLEVVLGRIFEGGDIGPAVGRCFHDGAHLMAQTAPLPDDLARAPLAYDMGRDPRAASINAFREVRAETERRAAPLSAEDQVIQSMPDASPTKWHRAHTTWFFEQFLLVPHADGYVPFDDRFAFLFNSYYVAAGPRHARPKRGLI